MEKKYYTFISCNRALTKNGDEYTNVATQIKLSNFKQKEINGTKLVTARASIANREKLLTSVLGKEITADEYGNVWIDVNFWGNNADNITKYMGDRETARLFVVGALSARTFEKTGGGEGLAIQISVNDWTSAETKKD